MPRELTRCAPAHDPVALLLVESEMSSTDATSSNADRLTYVTRHATHATAIRPSAVHKYFGEMRSQGFTRSRRQRR